MAICTTPMCSAGEASVSQMRAVWADYQGDVRVQQFGPTVQAISDSFDSAYHVYDPYIPFNPVCCTVADIGAQADAITNQILSAVGAQPLPSPPDTSNNWDNAILVLGLGLLAVVIAPELRRLRS